MKMSSILIGALACFTFVPGLLLKLDLKQKVANKKYTTFSDKKIMLLKDIESITLYDVHYINYEYAQDTSYMEYVTTSVFETLIVKQNGSTIDFKVTKNSTAQNTINNQQAFQSNFPFFKLNREILWDPTMRFDGKSKLNQYVAIKIKGPRLPKIIAVNSKIYIDSIDRSSAFDFNLDFSVVYWQNFGNQNGISNKNLTHPWQMKSLNILIKEGAFYLNKDLLFDSLSIKAINRTYLHLEGYDYKNVNLVVDETARIDAPYAVWKTLKLEEDEMIDQMK